MERLDNGAFGNTMASHFHLSDAPAIVREVKRLAVRGDAPDLPT